VQGVHVSHELDLIVTLTGGLSAALAFGLFTQKLGLSPIVGYLLAGVLVGPFTPGFVAHQGIAEQLAEIGVILLMFGVGLHFRVEELLAVRSVALPGAPVTVAVAVGLGVWMAKLAGWTTDAGLVFGLAISVASTVVLLRVLSDQDQLHTRGGHIAVGWLVVEDILTVFALVLLPVLVGSSGQAGTAPVLRAVGVAILKLGTLVAFTFLVGRHLIPRLLAHVARTRSRELFTLAVLVIALGIAVGAAMLFGVSMALGAFLAGMVVGQSDFSSRAASEALPMRDAFAVLFFVSMGMLFDPTRALANLELTLAALAVVLLGKPLVALIVLRLLRQPLTGSLRIAASLAQIGEFSFILAALGRKLEVLPEAATQVVVATSIVSITLSPFLVRWASQVARWLPAETSLDGAATAAASGEPGYRALVVGYGPVGRTLVRLLRENGIAPTVIELNHETVQQLKEEGIAAIYGDAAQAQILEHAGAAHAGSLIFAAGGSPPDEVIRAAKALNPEILVLARSSYVSEAEGLKRAGAEVIVAAEAEVALAMSERLLIELGATADQLDRERDRVRAELAAV
jgi:CPA2 family monovalent cation:H+ antiporter-2